MKREVKFEYGFNSVNGILKKKYYLHEIPFMHSKCDVWQILPLVYVREYIGTTDKKGIEIYEGDILINPIGKKGVVEFVNGSFCLHYQKNNRHYYDVLDNGYCLNKEIIGNIYENPELLILK